MCLACGSASRADPRVTHGWCRPTATHQQACKVPSFCIGGAFLAWIIRTRCGPQPEEKAACALQAGMWKRLAGRPSADAGPSPPTRNFTSKRCNVASFCIGRSLAPWIIRTRCGPQPEEKAACAVLSCRLMQPTHQPLCSLYVACKCNCPDFVERRKCRQVEATMKSTLLTIATTAFSTSPSESVPVAAAPRVPPSEIKRHRVATRRQSRL
jgi:hypothetical protein